MSNQTCFSLESSQEATLFKFNLEQYCKELRRELSMRRKVWAKLDGQREKFVSMEHQRQYDVMKELLDILSHVGYPQWQKVVECSGSNLKVVQLSMMDF